MKGGANMYIHLSDTEINKLLKENFMILYDTREQVNEHILSYFDKKKIPYKKQKIDEGDYTAIITARPDMGIYRDLYFNVTVERKNSVDEFAANVCEKKDDYRDNARLERELERAKTKGTMVFLVIEDKDGKENIIKGNYRTNISCQALWGKLNSLEVKYLHGVIFTSKEDSGRDIWSKLHYAVKYFLRIGSLDISPAAEEN